MIDRQENAWQGLHWELPPLILHPFDRGRDCSWALGSIRLSLLLSGLADAELEKEPLLRARFLEFRMLCLIGKDVMRWLAQCDDFAARDQALASSGICPQSFADLLINRTPPEVAGRFESWAVSDFRRILSRAIGINAVFRSRRATPRFLQASWRSITLTRTASLTAISASPTLHACRPPHSALPSILPTSTSPPSATSPMNPRNRNCRIFAAGLKRLGILDH